MGAIGCEDAPPYLFPSGAWEHKSWKTDNDNPAQHINSYQACSANVAGLTTYQSVADKDIDRFSTYSSDDACSNAGSSVFDTSSVVSSQSSHSSASSEASDDAFEERDASCNRSSLESFLIERDTSKATENQAELLTGLQSRTSAIVQADGYADRHSSSQTIPRSAPSSVQTGKCNRRRSGSYDSTNGPPCRLKRDTDSADCFVMLLITFAARLITAIWPLSASPPMMSSCFNGAGVLPLEVFIHETLRRSKTSYSTLQVALFYIILLKDKLSDRDFTKEQPKPEDRQQQSSGASTCRAMQCGRRMFLAALMLASKYLQDRNYSTRAWSKISGLRIPEINENETEYLRCIDYRLHMKRDAFENWSKIVLTLSKLSKIQPGCSSKLDSFRKSDSGADSLLAAMAADPTLRDSSFRHAPYSNQWWTELLKKLEPEMVNDVTHTEAFLRDNLPLDDSVTELLARHENALPTPPTSPDASPPHVPDMTFNEALPSRNAPAPRLPTPTEMRAPSPARTSLPLRPQLNNLPTPQSTPRGADPCPWLNVSNDQQQSLRCSASVDALRAIRKQCMANASLERCPPPRPQSLAHPPARSLTRPAVSTLACYSGSATPAVLSPTNSVSSASTPQSFRSRSSSISSTSSWSSWGTGTPRSHQAQIRSQAPSPLSRVVSAPEVVPTDSDASAMPAHSLRRKPNLPSECAPQAYQQSTSGVAHFYDEGYGSGEDPNANCASRSSQSEVDAAEGLLKLGSANNSTPTPRHLSGESTQTPRGHKRTISKTNDPRVDLQEHVSRMLQGKSMEDQVMEDPTPTFHCVQSYKEWQKPTKNWAVQKKPAPNRMDTKRVALYCAVNELSAPELASQYLKDQMITA